MRITSKGQVTIPLEIRQKAGLLPNTEVEFGMKNGGVTLKKIAAKTTRGSQLIQNMRGKASSKMTTEQILALTRD